MFGDNPKRPPVKGDGSILQVQSIFKTFQGEGPFAGMAAIFIRLGGCNLACSFCDTEFESFEAMSLEAIFTKLNEQDAGQSIKLVVITGGEPFRQPIEQLCQKLVDLRYQVQIETNGTLYRPVPPEVNIVCSPKVSDLGHYSIIRQDLLERLSAIKFLIAKNIQGYNQVPEIGQTKYNIPVFLQPIDQNDERLNQENTKLAMDIAMAKGCRLSIQLHKILGIE